MHEIRVIIKEILTEVNEGRPIAFLVMVGLTALTEVGIPMISLTQVDQFLDKEMIRELNSEDAQAIFEIVNQAASVYKGSIPDDCYHEPYMPKAEVLRELKNMAFFGWQAENALVGVMAIQPVQDVTLIRHAYVLPGNQRAGVGRSLLAHLIQIAKTRRLLVGTWADAVWAIDFYQKQGFKLMPNKDELLKRYWDILQRQVEKSVVLGIEI